MRDATDRELDSVALADLLWQRAAAAQTEAPRNHDGTISVEQLAAYLQVPVDCVTATANGFDVVVPEPMSKLWTIREISIEAS